MAQIQDLCLSLAKCETEVEIIELLKQHNYWDDATAWQYFGGDENNFSTIGNQQSKPESALVEKIVNSVDAVLMAECLKRGIKPDGPDAPESIKEALAQFLNIRDGKLTNISDSARSQLAEKISLVATGSRMNPTYTLIDRGEGQSPSRMPDTILSLRRSNKLRIPFVQGKFNMGGTGVFRFCGESNIQVIISKRHPEIAASENDPTANQWGFTVIRREDPTAGVRSSNYKYLSPGGEILSFAADALPLLPGRYPSNYVEHLEYGTFMKFLEYQIGPGLRTVAILDLYNKLSLLMPEIALPVKIFERRPGYRANSYEAVLSGLSVRVNEDRSENIEDNFPASGYINPGGHLMKFSTVVFKKGKQEKYKKDEGIVFTVNGQTHGVISKAFFNRKDIGLGYLADSLLVVLDCSEIQGRAREDLFMNSRDRLSNHPLRKKIEVALETILKDHEGLRSLKEKRRSEEIDNRLQNSRPMTEVLKSVLRKSPTLSRLFVQGLHLQDPSVTEPGGPSEEFVGLEFPCFFTLITKYPQHEPKKAHLNSRFRIDYKTDVANDYFDRNNNRGTFKLFINGVLATGETLNLWNGYAHLTVDLGPRIVGEQIHFRSEVIDNTMTSPIIEDFFVQVVNPAQPGGSKPSGPRPPSNNRPGNTTSRPSGLALPNIIEISRDGRTGHTWHEQNFNEMSALKIKGSEEEGYDFFVNVDNAHLLSELRALRNRDYELITAKYKFGMVLIGIALLNSDFEIAKDEETNIFDIIAETAKSISPMIIPLVETLGSLELSDVTAIAEEQE